jgi:hypothetical protein
MDTKRICKQCLQPWPQDVPEGICPRCLAKAIQASAQPSQIEWPVLVAEVGKILALTAFTAFGMREFDSAWVLLLLLLEGWTADRSAGPPEKRWIKAVWIVSVLGLSGYGVWLTKSAWPLVALLYLLNWGKDEKEQEDEDESDEDDLAESESGSIPFDPQLGSADSEGLCAALPFVLQKPVRGAFGVVSGLMRLEAAALVLEFEVKSIRSSVRTQLREVRIPYKEIALADFDDLNRLVLRTARTQSLAEVPTSGQGELTCKPELDEMKHRAARRFVAFLNRRISGQLPRSP